MNKLSSAVVMVIIFVTAGCRSEIRPVVYYTLSPMQAALSGKTDMSGNELSIGVGPVGFPDYLNRPHIATRDDFTKVAYSETHRWAGLPEKLFAGVIAENLSVSLGTNRIRIYPWDGTFEPRYQVMLEVIRFDGRLGDQARLNVIWRVIDHATSEQPVVRRSVIKEPVVTGGSDGYEALVAALSRALEQMSRDIVDVIATKAF